MQFLQSAVRRVLAIGAVCLMQLSPAVANEEGRISFQLNGTAGVKDACRFNFIFQNYY